MRHRLLFLAPVLAGCAALANPPDRFETLANLPYNGGYIDGWAVQPNHRSAGEPLPKRRNYRRALFREGIKLDEADFTNADLTGAFLMGNSCKRTVFDYAILQDLVIVGEVSFEDATAYRAIYRPSQKDRLEELGLNLSQAIAQEEDVEPPAGVVAGQGLDSPEWGYRQNYYTAQTGDNGARWVKTPGFVIPESKAKAPAAEAGAPAAGAGRPAPSAPGPGPALARPAGSSSSSSSSSSAARSGAPGEQQAFSSGAAPDRGPAQSPPRFRRKLDFAAPSGSSSASAAAPVPPDGDTPMDDLDAGSAAAGRAGAGEGPDEVVALMGQAGITFDQLGVFLSLERSLDQGKINTPQKCGVAARQMRGWLSGEVAPKDGYQTARRTLLAALGNRPDAAAIAGRILNAAKRLAGRPQDEDFAGGAGFGQNSPGKGADAGRGPAASRTAGGKPATPSPARKGGVRKPRASAAVQASSSSSSSASAWSGADAAPAASPGRPRLAGTKRKADSGQDPQAQQQFPALPPLVAAPTAQTGPMHDAHHEGYLAGQGAPMGQPGAYAAPQYYVPATLGPQGRYLAGYGAPMGQPGAYPAPQYYPPAAPGHQGGYMAGHGAPMWQPGAYAASQSYAPAPQVSQAMGMMGLAAPGVPMAQATIRTEIQLTAVAPHPPQAGWFAGLGAPQVQGGAFPDLQLTGGAAFAAQGAGAAPPDASMGSSSSSASAQANPPAPIPQYSIPPDLQLPGMEAFTGQGAGASLESMALDGDPAGFTSSSQELFPYVLGDPDDPALLGGFPGMPDGAR